MDRINNLPEETVCHILSFLSTKEAARTSVLSKRWRNLFAFSSNLCFDEYSNLHYKNLCFHDFVDRVLSVSGDSQVKKFTLKCGDCYKSAHIDIWIRNVLKRGALELVLYIYERTRPLEIFTCKTLVSLTLGTRSDTVMVPENASLPALKTLFLDRVLFSSPEDKGCGFEALLYACPVLEELHLVDVEWTKVDVKASSASLKSVAIYERTPPLEIFTCKTLVNLRLGTWSETVLVPENASLPALKALYLDQVLLWSHEDKGCGFEALLSACPVLEELELVDVASTKADVKVSSASLKSLTIYWLTHEDTFSFDTPSLVYFDFFGYIPRDFPMFKMENLLQARLQLDPLPEILLNRATSCNSVMKLMNGIRSVQHLDLSRGILELSLCCESIPTFNNLKSLAIRSKEFGGWKAVPVFLRSCPNIETLVIEGVKYHIADTCGDTCKLHFSGAQMSFTHIVSRSKDGIDSLVLCDHERDENVKACLGQSSVQCQIPSDS